MTQIAVIKTGGKQYLAKVNDTLTVDKLDAKKDEKVDLDALLKFDTNKTSIEMGSPLLRQKVKVQVVEHLLGDKVRVARFKAKVRYRRVRGFRQHLSKIKILEIK